MRRSCIFCGAAFACIAIWDFALSFREMPYLARSQILTGYATLARSLGLSPERLTRSVRLDPHAVDDLDARISAQAFADLLERSSEAARIEDFGLRLAESRALGILGPIGIVVHQEPDLRSALHSLARYLPFHNESLALRLEETRELAIFSLDVKTSSPGRGYQVTELSVGAFFRILCRLAGSDWKPHRVCFEHAAPRSQDAHRRFFGCRVEFEHEFNGIVFRASDLDTPLAMSDEMLAKYAHRYLDAMMVHRGATVDEKVRELVRLLLSSGNCTAGKVARGLGVDRRTMHRYLAANGETFSSVLTDVRKELAMRLLPSHRSFSQIAEQLGFAGTPVFSRWFRQAFGCCPSQWRAATPPKLGGAA
jgi:AraC-like DNA-binding protein